MNSGLKPVWELAARVLAYAFATVCIFMGKEVIVQLKTIQADLANIKTRLIVIETRAVTSDEVRALIREELQRGRK